jgi:LytS/YehU family sensor histidine kinase
LFNFVLTSVLITGLSLGLRVSEKLSENEKLRKEAEKERLNQDLMLLRNQINPHFLFNTLNTIYSLALIRSEHTAEAVMKLSDMMRYVIQDVNRDFVPLALELDYIRQYVGLQKLRLNEMVTTLLEIEGEPGGLDIAPVILVPFVENTFKHGTSAHEQATILIRIILRDTTLEMLTENRIFPGRPSGETFGIGLRNTRKRLELIYPESHELVYGETEGVFRLHLQIRLG